MNSARISESERYEPAGTAANLSKFTIEVTGPDADRNRSVSRRKDDISYFKDGVEGNHDVNTRHETRTRDTRRNK